MQHTSQLVDLNKPQTELLVEHFKYRPSISADEARSLYRIRSLSRRIVDMTNDGHGFSKVKQEDPTGRKYVRYFHLGHRVPSSSMTTRLAG